MSLEIILALHFWEPGAHWSRITERDKGKVHWIRIKLCVETVLHFLHHPITIRTKSKRKWCPDALTLHPSSLPLTLKNYCWTEIGRKSFALTPPFSQYIKMNLRRNSQRVHRPLGQGDIPSAKWLVRMIFKQICDEDQRHQEVAESNPPWTWVTKSQHTCVRQTNKKLNKWTKTVRWANWFPPFQTQIVLSFKEQVDFSLLKYKCC